MLLRIVQPLTILLVRITIWLLNFLGSLLWMTTGCHPLWPRGGHKVLSNFDQVPSIFSLCLLPRVRLCMLELLQRSFLDPRQTQSPALNVVGNGITCNKTFEGLLFRQWLLTPLDSNYNIFHCVCLTGSPVLVDRSDKSCDGDKPTPGIDLFLSTHESKVCVSAVSYAFFNSRLTVGTYHSARRLLWGYLGDEVICSENGIFARLI